MRPRMRRPVMFVTGGSGFLGRHLTASLPVAAAWEIVAPTSREMDITDQARTFEAIESSRPDVVVHLAYRKGDREVIVDGTRNVAAAAAAVDARLVHVSTDIVFAGRPAPYVEADVPDPIIDYGRHKADAERAVADAAHDAAIIRTSLLYGTDIPSPFQNELAAGLRSGHAPMTFFVDEYRCPIHCADVAEAIAAVAARRDIVGPLHVAGPEPVSRLDFAAALARYHGFAHVALPATTIAESGMVRSGNVVLDTSLAATLGIRCRDLAGALAT